MKKIMPRWLAENEFICMGKLHEPIWQVQFLVFEKFFCAYLHQIAIKIMLLLVNNLHEKRIIESQDGWNLGRARAICNLQCVSKLGSRCMKNALVLV